MQTKTFLPTLHQQMSQEYAGKSDKQIIEENFTDLDAKSKGPTGDSFNPRTTVLSEQSQLNESGVDKFPGAEVHHGRTGQTGSSLNSRQTLGEADGADPIGENSDRYEGPGGPEDKKQQTLANNPGGYDAAPRGIDQVPDRSKAEAVPVTTGQELQPNQEETARSHGINS